MSFIAWSEQKIKKGLFVGLTLVLCLTSSPFAYAQNTSGDSSFIDSGDSEQAKIWDRGLGAFDAVVQTCSTVSAVDSSGWNNVNYKGDKIFSDDQVTKIKSNQETYQKAAAKVGIPWQMLAVVHLREHGLAIDNPSNGQGVYQDYGYTHNNGKPYPPGPVDDAEFLRQSINAAQDLYDGAAKSLRPGLASGNADSVKSAFYGYNSGAASHAYEKQATSLGFPADKRYEGSPYVMNRADEKRDPTVEPTKSNNTWGQIKSDGGSISYPANSGFGAYVMYGGLGASTSNSSACDSATAGGTATVDGLTFPLSITKKLIKAGTPWGKGSAKWCYAKTTSCHHDYNAADIHANPGTPIIAATAGEVIMAGTGSGAAGGPRASVEIRDERGNVWFYTHGTPNSQVVKKGQKVTSGQKLMTVGPSTAADNTAPHLHIDELPSTYKRRMSCASASCSTYPFIDIQPGLVKSYGALPEG